MMDKKIFSLENFIKLGILLSALFAFAYDIKSDVREIIVNSRADGRINENRFVILEKAKDNHEERLSSVERNVFEIRAILPKETRIKGE